MYILYIYMYVCLYFDAVYTMVSTARVRYSSFYIACNTIASTHTYAYTQSVHFIESVCNLLIPFPKTYTIYFAWRGIVFGYRWDLWPAKSFVAIVGAVCAAVLCFLYILFASVHIVSPAQTCQPTFFGYILLYTSDDGDTVIYPRNAIIKLFFFFSNPNFCDGHGHRAFPREIKKKKSRYRVYIRRSTGVPACVYTMCNYLCESPRLISQENWWWYRWSAGASKLTDIVWDRTRNGSTRPDPGYRRRLSAFGFGGNFVCGNLRMLKVPLLRIRECCSWCSEPQSDRFAYLFHLRTQNRNAFYSKQRKYIK